MMQDKAKHYLIYVTHYDITINGNNISIYEYEGDVFHAMGEIMFRSKNPISYITYVEYSEEKAKFWKENNHTIHRWIDKY